VLLLALDTSGGGVAVALHDGTRLLAQRWVAGGQRHAEHLAPAIAEVLASTGAGRPGAAGLSGIVVGVGPGPFTGLRVGLVTAQLLAATLAVPVHGICSLDALAEAAAEAGVTGPLMVATDARRREVYWAGYRLGPGLPGGWRRVGAPQVGPPAAAAAELAGDPRPVVTGRGAQLYPDLLGEPAPGLPLDAGAGALAAIAARALTGAGPGEVLLPPRPLYLRRPDARVPGERKPVLQ
jgi:tRNA threonylcarbamoyl adenosine modification protein YeaZ